MVDVHSRPFAALVLAAGLSRRMGTPKMLLPWGDTSVLGQVIRTLSAAAPQEIVIVTGGARQAVEAEAARLEQRVPVRLVFNPLHESGEMLSSLQCGLAALAVEVQAAMVALGDQPQLSAGAVLKVSGAWETSPAGLIVPSFNRRRGHPWLVQRELWGGILALKPGETLRDFLSNHAADIQYVETDESVLKDLDTPEEYAHDKP